MSAKARETRLNEMEHSLLNGGAFLFIHVSIGKILFSKIRLVFRPTPNTGSTIGFSRCGIRDVGCGKMEQRGQSKIRDAPIIGSGMQDNVLFDQSGCGIMFYLTNQDAG